MNVPAVVLIARSILLVTVVVTGNRGSLLGTLVIIPLHAGPPSVVSPSTKVFVKSRRSRRTLLKAIAFLRIRCGTLEIGSLATVAVARVRLVRSRGTGGWAWGLILNAIS